MPYVLAAGASDFRRRCSRAVVALYFFIRWKRKKKQKTMKYSIRAVVNKQTNKKNVYKKNQPTERKRRGMRVMGAGYTTNTTEHMTGQFVSNTISNEDK